MEEVNITEQKSLEIISMMIQSTRKKIEENSGVPFLIWGYITVFVSIFEFIVENQKMNPYLNFGWFLIPILGWLFMIQYLKNKKNKKLPKNFIDKAINLVWLVTSIAALMGFIASMFTNTSILFFMTLLMGIGTTLTGGLIKFKLLIISGFIGIFGSLAFVLPFNFECRGINILIFAAIFALMMVVPGHILNHKTKE